MVKLKEFIFETKLKLALLVLKGEYNNIIIKRIGLYETTVINLDACGKRKNKITYN